MHFLFHSRQFCTRTFTSGVLKTTPERNHVLHANGILNLKIFLEKPIYIVSTASQLIYPHTKIQVVLLEYYIR